MEVENEYHKTEKRAALLVLKFKLAIRLKVTFIFEKNNRIQRYTYMWLLLFFKPLHSTKDY